VFVERGTVTLISSTISSNRANRDGGALYSRGQYVEEEGVLDFGLVTLTNSTIAGNTSRHQGGGVDIASYGTVRLNNSTISSNTASDAGGLFNRGVGQTRLKRALISGNTASRGHEVYNLSPTHYFYIGNFNLFGHRELTNAQALSGFTPGPSDITATSNGNDPTALSNILNPTLANNGGPTRTHALVAGSPAIDTLTDGTCPPPIRISAESNGHRMATMMALRYAIPDRLNDDNVFGGDWADQVAGWLGADYILCPIFIGVRQ
jgi:hypothetical protein